MIVNKKDIFGNNSFGNLTPKNIINDKFVGPYEYSIPTLFDPQTPVNLKYLTKLSTY
jgi:hypothetical protein